MIMIYNQDRDEIIQTEQIWYEKHYAKGIDGGEIYCGVNLYAYDLKGVKRLAGTFDNLLEAHNELIKINNSDEYVKHVTIY